MQLSAWVTLYPHHEHAPAQSAQELAVLEGGRDPRFIPPRKGSKYFFSWLCGFVASIRVCFCVTGLQTLLCSGLAGSASGNTGNVSEAKEGDLGLFQPAKRNVASSAQRSIEAAACFVSHDLEPPYFFSPCYRAALKRMSVCGLLKGLCSPV